MSKSMKRISTMIYEGTLKCPSCEKLLDAKINDSKIFNLNKTSKDALLPKAPKGVSDITFMELYDMLITKQETSSGGKYGEIPLYDKWSYLVDNKEIVFFCNETEKSNKYFPVEKVRLKLETINTYTFTAKRFVLSISGKKNGVDKWEKIHISTETLLMYHLDSVIFSQLVDEYALCMRQLAESIKNYLTSKNDDTNSTVEEKTYEIESGDRKYVTTYRDLMRALLFKYKKVGFYHRFEYIDKDFLLEYDKKFHTSYSSQDIISVEYDIPVFIIKTDEFIIHFRMSINGNNVIVEVYRRNKNTLSREGTFTLEEHKTISGGINPTIDGILILVHSFFIKNMG